jgi:hypothetical protein
MARYWFKQILEVSSNMLLLALPSTGESGGTVQYNNLNAPSTISLLLYNRDFPIYSEWECVIEICPWKTSLSTSIPDPP